MMSRHHRKGSALLIVLGMLAFMIVSAVGFAAYMRYARMPSSHLRRVVASRHLVKAALARAIDELDRAVNNNPHPNVGDRHTPDVGFNRNVWQGRVLVGTNCFCNVFTCVENNYPAVLTLEALAYLPPSLVNSVRIHSRIVPTAQWKSFDFDAGRYAFCVVDVSDFLDVNRLRAGVPRSSASNSKVTLSYLFEEGRKHDSMGDGASQWDEFMKKYRDVDEETGEFDFSSKEPLISVADLNLALGKNGKIGGKVFSPFYEYVHDSKDVYGDLGEDETRDNICNMSFVTDSLFNAPASLIALEKETYDLSDAKHQPYPMEDLKKPAKMQETVVTSSLLTNSKWIDVLSGLGCGALADYLDEDSLPVSLAIPTTERVPMICGIRPVIMGSQVKIVKDAPKEEKVEAVGAKTRRVSCTVTYKLDANEFLKGFEGGHFQALAAYPFLRGDDDSKRSFTMDGRFSMFFSTDIPELRLVNLKDDFSIENGDPKTKLDKASYEFINVGISSAPIKLKDSVSTPKDALIKIADPSRLSVEKGTSITSDLEDFKLLEVTYKWTQTNSHQGNDWSPTMADVLGDARKVGDDGEIEAFSDLKVLDTATGKCIDFSGNSLGKELKSSGNLAGPKGIRLNCAVWMRIKEDDKVVDMVPASLLDDATQNGDNSAKESFGDIGEMVGRKNPIIPFETKVVFDLTLEALNDLADKNNTIVIDIPSEGVLVSDPRYNYAPEAWFKAPNNQDLDALWIDEVKKTNPKGEDIFMATSDAGYLQSVYELAFLPRLTDLDADVDLGSSAHTGKLSVPKGEGTKGMVATSAADTWCSTLAWKTYDSIGGDREKFEKLPWKNIGSGFKVNPYSDQTNILMAAYANTPLDWRRAATNVSEKTSVDHTELDAAEFNKEYAFNGYSKGGTLEWMDLEAVAGAHMAVVRRDPSRKWHENWDDWWSENPGDNEDSLCGIELTGEKTKLWDVDKKFLHGFWRDSFAAKQQLYMVFVRAEPMMMGSGSSKHLPPQLGGRAMALVWRDPTPTEKETTPHRTRVLFYRQFD